MNGRERVRLVIEGKLPDRVPVWAQLSSGYILRNSDLGTMETLDFLELARAELRLHEEYGFDGVFVSMSAPYLEYEPGQPWQGFPAGEVRSLESVEPGDWPPLQTKVTDEWAAPYDLVRGDYRETHHIAGWVLDSFSLASVWLGSVQQALLETMDRPERFQRLAEYLDQLNLATVRALATRARVDSVCISSPYAGSSFISRKQYQQLVAPSVSRIAAAARKAGLYSYLHNCGFTGDRLELQADTGVDGIECFDPPPVGDVELSDAKRRIGHRVFLKGNLDSVNVLYRGTDEEVEREIIRQLEVGKVGGRYMLSSACSVAPEVPPARVRLLVELAERYGRYDAS